MNIALSSKKKFRKVNQCEQKISAINDFVVKFANVNGSGSASANNLFAKAIFRMGIPVSPRNIFPSNIQGLPTWYEVRVSEAGYLAKRGRQVELMVSVNPQSMANDIKEVMPGGYFFYDNSYPLDLNMIRDDINYLGVPLTQICNAHYEVPRLRQLFKNIIYVGALAALLKIDFSVLEGLISDQFKAKPKLIPMNVEALKLGFDAAEERFACPLPIRLEQRDLLQDKILVDGNTACGLGCVYGGATVAAWYPITPSTSVAEAFDKYANKLRTEDDGSRNFIVIQAEDELAAMGMTIGAGWNGARSFTATSGPGLSLMNEFLGLAYFAEVPTVLIDVQRAGPSTGMPTRTQQSDVLPAAYASHGDTKNVLLFPASPKECFDLTASAFDIAEQLQTPVIMLTDLDLGMNEHISEPLDWDDERQYKRGKVLSAEQLDKMERFGRYLDIDDDGITYRTYPGTHPEKGAFFTRGTSRDDYAVYTEDGDIYAKNLERLLKKWATAPDYLPKPVPNLRDSKASVGIIHYGTSNEACREALDHLQSNGQICNDLRLKAFPFHQSVLEFIEQHDTVFVIDQNRDGQMRTLLINELEINPEKLTSILNFNGDPLSSSVVLRQIKSHLESAQLTSGK
ncbi:MAG: 2-oxoacid:acceptor oxidoreductase subunit alpha [Arenicella sp.]